MVRSQGVPNRDRLTLAVVDDDEDVRIALDRLLRAMGHDVQVFPTAEAFDADTARIDCLILDVRLPGLSGVEFCELIRLRGSRLPIVLITGNSDPSPGEGLRTIEDINAFSLMKPFSEEDLMNAINRAIAAAHHAH
jgi:FixJ family two-component response regulator